MYGPPRATRRCGSHLACQLHTFADAAYTLRSPFNFPMMVPFWTIPIAIGMGNTVVLKPSEKVPYTAQRFIDMLKEAGFPDGVLNIVNGPRREDGKGWGGRSRLR